VETGRGNVFVLGKWARDPAENVYYEYFFLERLSACIDKNVHAEWTSDLEGGQKCPGCMDKNVQAAWTDLSMINIESNIETNREGISNISKEPSDPTPSTSSANEELEALISPELETLIETCSREFDDMAHLESNQTRAFNLWAKTRFDAAEMLVRTRQARETTKLRIGSSAVKNRQKKMAYFFAVLEDVLGLKQAKS
jgi:hypothetical protein